MDEILVWLDEKMRAEIPPDMIPSEVEMESIAARRLSLN